MLDPEELLARREALEESMRDVPENGYDTFVFVITNILNAALYQFLVVGDYKDEVAQAAHSKLYRWITYITRSCFS